jgi:hypothetical protein
MPEIKIQINSCKDCPHCKVTRLYTEDSWEHAEDYWCKGVKATPLHERGRESLPYKLIRGYVEWDSEIPAPPRWCPLVDEDYKTQLQIAEAKVELSTLQSTIIKIQELGGVASKEQLGRLKELNSIISLEIKLD